MPMRIVERFKDVLKRGQDRLEDSGSPAVQKGRFRWSLVTLNFPFMAGMVLVLFLLAVAFFGPRFASENPYLSGQRSAEMVDGELVFPPFSPMPQFPLGSDQWGRDILSMLLYGARNTLVACLFVTMARLALGLVLGALAGWKTGGLADRAVMSLVGIVSSLPTLLVGVILILALDIRRGLSAFLIALCFVGWGEIAQYIRSEFVSLREQPFVEGARVIGLTEAGIMIRHILPNVLPSLVVLTLLEMGSVLMILGELGFVGVFIGGGVQTATYQDETVYIADIPEWGAMLSGARTFMRSAPWMIFYPAMAFFMAVLGFNLLGEGLRRIIREAGVNTAALVSKRMILVVGVIILATWYVTDQVAPDVSYAKLATQFEGERALEHTRAIVELEREDPGFGTEGALRAAEYIAGEFETAGALPAATAQSYLQRITRNLARRFSVPELAAMPLGGSEWTTLEHGADFGEQVYRHGGSGDVDGVLTFIAFSGGGFEYGDFRGLDLRGQVALVLGDNVPFKFDNEALIRGALAILFITDDVDPQIDWDQDERGYMEKPGFPIIHVRPEAADRLLEGSGYRVTDLRGTVSDLELTKPEKGWSTQELPVRVRVRVELSEPEEVTGYNVLAVMPGSDTAVDEQAVFVTTHYDMPEPDPGEPFLAASDGPAGVGVMLEMLRLWNTEEFRPRRTVLLAAWAGGYLSSSGASTYMRGFSPYVSLTREGVVHLGSVGGGGDTLLLDASGDALLGLLERSSSIVGVSIRQETLDSHSYSQEMGRASVVLAWELAPDPYGGNDAVESLSATHLGKIGEVVNLALMTASRQFYY
jgi:ABC-type dipeptide/oligopeptide/nickel transport system permease subunit